MEVDGETGEVCRAVWEPGTKGREKGSVNPAGIIAPAIVATFMSTLVVVAYCKVKDRKCK